MVNFFEDPDWEELGALARQRARDTAIAWKIAAAVAIGMGMGGGLVYVVDHGMVRGSMSDAVRALRQLVRADDPAVTGPAKASAPERLATRHDDAEPAPAVAESQAEPGAISAVPEGADREAASTQSALQEAAAQKERAWARYYTKPVQCDVNPGRDTIVECANHYIRARRQFEAAYAAGKR